MQLQRVSPYKKGIAFVLCLAGFVGFAGLHRFYVRSWFTGILYLVTGGLFGVGTLVDLVRIIMGSFRDSNNLYLESEARRAWDRKYAKWRYVYWSAAVGRYFVDATSIDRNELENTISCVYLIELNFAGKTPFKQNGMGSAVYSVQQAQFFREGSIVRVAVNSVQVLNKDGAVICEETLNNPFEIVEKDSMNECIYLAVVNS